MNITPADPVVVDRVSEDDREWFERHERQRWRVRPGVPGEFPREGDDALPWTVVRSCGRIRFRFPVRTPPPAGLTQRGLDLVTAQVLPDGAQATFAHFDAMRGKW